MKEAAIHLVENPVARTGSTHSTLREISLPGTGKFALIVIANDNGRKPATLSRRSLRELAALLERVKDRALAGEVVGVGIMGAGNSFVAGADLKAISELKDTESARALARLGHDVFGILGVMGVPTFAFINGAAIGGGLEIALAARYRTTSSGANGISLPEAFLGLVPGWGGVYRLPRLIGPGNAVKVMIENALSNNKALDGASAFELGIADAIFTPEDFLEESLEWAARIIQADTVTRKQIDERRAEKGGQSEADWDAAIAAGRAIVEAKTGQAALAPARLMDLLETGKTLSRTESAALEIEVLAELMLSPEFKNSVYGFLELIQRRAKHPSGAPDAQLARPVRKVGVVGAGLMASQLALLFARQLKVPVVMTDIDQVRVDRGVGYVHAQVDKLLTRNRISAETAARTKALVTGSVCKASFADADFVVEAVFEELSVKKQVFAEVEAVVSDDCIIATNTSSLSVTEMAADLLHPERLVGFHFFNPVAVMPLLEIVRAPKTSDEVLATAFVLSKVLGKTAVPVRDSAGFVVNRLLLRLLSEVINAFDEGTPAEVADDALRPMGLPMSPFTLLAMVGIPVAHHITQSLHAVFGERFRVSDNLQRLVDHGITSLWASNGGGNRSIPVSTLDLLEFGSDVLTSEQLLKRVQGALAEEIGLLLEEGVVAAAEDVDLCMLLGARWPLHMGGITPYLDQVGASVQRNGNYFHPHSNPWKRNCGAGRSAFPDRRI